MDDLLTPDLLDALGRLLEFLVATFGPWGTIGLFTLILAGLGVRRFWNESRADKYIDRILDEKDRAIERMAKQEREWRIFFMMREAGVSRQQAESLIKEIELPSPEDTRKGKRRRRGRRR